MRRLWRNMNYDKKPVLKCRCTPAGGLFYKKKKRRRRRRGERKKIQQEKCRIFTAVNKWSPSTRSAFMISKPWNESFSWNRTFLTKGLFLKKCKCKLGFSWLVQKNVKAKERDLTLCLNCVMADLNANLEMFLDIYRTTNAKYFIINSQ